MYIILAALCAFIVGCSAGSDAPAEPPPPDVTVANVLSRSVQAWDEFNGRVRAVPTVELRPRVSGYINRVAYQEGARSNLVIFSLSSIPAPTAMHFIVHRHSSNMRAQR